jgi:hypothetical protein
VVAMRTGGPVEIGDHRECHARISGEPERLKPPPRARSPDRIRSSSCVPGHVDRRRAPRQPSPVRCSQSRNQPCGCGSPQERLGNQAARRVENWASEIARVPPRTSAERRVRERLRRRRGPAAGAGSRISPEPVRGSAFTGALLALASSLVAACTASIDG